MIRIIKNYILASNGYWYEISKNTSERCICIECQDGQHYTVKTERYIIGNDGFLYKILENNEINGKIIIGRDKQKYYVEDNAISIKKSDSNLREFNCKPSPRIRLKGIGNVKCNPRTGICEVNALKGTKIDIGAKKGYKKMFDGRRAWLEKQ